jgi:hypothetical protein
MKRLLNHEKIIGIFLAIFILIASSSYLYGKEKKEVDLIIRTINVHHGSGDYPLRLRGIAQELYRDYPAQIGLIGIQELARGRMTDCVCAESFMITAPDASLLNLRFSTVRKLKQEFLKKTGRRIFRRAWA